MKNYSERPSTVTGYPRHVTYPGRYGDRGACPPPSGRHRRSADRQGLRQVGGAEGNERLTVTTGAVLLVLLAAEGLTILSIGRLLTLHFFLGMLLLGPVALKAGSVTYRFFRYYTGSAPYRRKAWSPRWSTRAGPARSPRRRRC